MQRSDSIQARVKRQVSIRMLLNLHSLASALQLPNYTIESAFTFFTHILGSSKQLSYLKLP